MRGNRFLVCIAILILIALCLFRPSLIAESSGVIELAKNWELISASKLTDSGAMISQPTHSTAHWYPIRRMPATVLEILQENGVYPNLYYGMNLLSEVPQDLYKQEWWYRTSFTIPAGHETYWLDFPGINYRAEIWLNGKLVANNKQAVGMYVDHRFNVTGLVRPGSANTLAVKVTPEQAIQDVDRVELADSWFDWINWKYLGYKGPLDSQRLNASNLAATYEASGDYPATGPVSAKVAITAASTTNLTLTATVISGRVPVTGTVKFLYDGNPIGTGAVNANGVADPGSG